MNSKHAWSASWKSILYDYIPTYIVHTSLHIIFMYKFCGWRQPQAFPLNEMLVTE